jgi:hypothetical protein
VALPLWDMAYAVNVLQGWPPCDAICEEDNKMISNQATFERYNT